MNEETGRILNEYYNRYHKADYIYPDPLIFPRRYSDKLDVEAAAFISASFALGRVNLIISFLERIFDALGNPYEGLVSRSEKELEDLFSDFKYRFYSPADIIHFMVGLRGVFLEYGSLEACFMQGFNDPGLYGLEAVPAAAGLASIAEAVNREGSSRNVVSNPLCGSACKRLFLFLRWVVRKDELDPGGWQLDPSELIIPLDTHVMKVGTRLGLTSRKSPDMKTAIEITENLKTFDKKDPVKYDFSMSRIGIHPDLSYTDLEIYIAGEKNGCKERNLQM